MKYLIILIIYLCSVSNGFTNDDDVIELPFKILSANLSCKIFTSDNSSHVIKDFSFDTVISSKSDDNKVYFYQQAEVGEEFRYLYFSISRISGAGKVMITKPLTEQEVYEIRSYLRADNTSYADFDIKYRELVERYRTLECIKVEEKLF